MEVFKNIFDNLGITEFARPSLGISDILDILIVAYIIYKIIFWIKETRAWVLFKGILVIFALAAVAMLLKLNTILWILSNTISVGIIAVIVVFQPELRKALEQLGKGKFFTAFARSSEETDDKAAQRTVDEIVKAAEKMGSVKTGALILIEQKVPLGDFERTGIPVDAIVSSQLLINIFEHNTPLHDGAVIVQAQPRSRRYMLSAPDGQQRGQHGAWHKAQSRYRRKRGFRCVCYCGFRGNRRHLSGKGRRALP